MGRNLDRLSLRALDDLTVAQQDVGPVRQMLDLDKCTGSEIRNYPLFRNSNSGLINNAAV